MEEIAIKFGELRSLLQGFKATELEGQKLEELVLYAQARDEVRYRERWVPYLQGFEILRRVPCIHCAGLGDLEKKVALMPFAKFIYYVGGSGALKGLLEHPLASSVGKLQLSGASLREGEIELIEQKCQGVVDLQVMDGLEESGLAKLASAGELGQRLEGLSFGHYNFMTASGLGDLVGRGNLVRLKRLELSGNRIGDRGVKLLVESAVMEGLEELRVSGCQLSWRAMEALGRSTKTENLKALWLRYNDLGDRGVEALGRSSHLLGLEHLELSSTGVGDKGVRALAQWPLSLRSLKLGMNRVGVGGARALAGSEMFEQLEELELSHNQIRDQGMEALVEGEGLVSLKRLALGENGIVARGLNMLSTSMLGQGLRSLDLSNNPLGLEGVRALTSGVMQGLEQVQLGECGVGVEAAGMLPGAMPGLRGLFLGSNEVGDRGISLWDWERLETLDLSRNKVTDEGAYELARGVTRGSMYALILDGNEIGEAGLMALAMSKELQGVRWLNLRANKVNIDRGYELIKELPLCEAIML